MRILLQFLLYPMRFREFEVTMDGYPSFEKLKEMAVEHSLNLFKKQQADIKDFKMMVSHFEEGVGIYPIELTKEYWEVAGVGEHYERLNIMAHVNVRPTFKE